MHSREDDDLQDLSMIQKEVEEAKAILDSALEHIVQAEKALVPRNGSIETLASILGYLPRDHLYRVLASCTQNIVRIHNSMENPVTDLYYGWLSLVAKVPKLPHKMFVNIVKRMGKCKGVREQPLSGTVVLSRWISQGYLGKGGALIRNTCEVSSLNSGPLDLGLVLSAIDKHREKVFRQTKGIFKLLHDLERYREVFGILAQIQDLGLKLPRDIIGPTIEIMSKYDLQLAYRIQKMFYTGLRTNKQVLRPDLNPTTNLESNGNTLLRKDATIQKVGIFYKASVASHDRTRDESGHCFRTNRCSMSEGSVSQRSSMSPPSSATQRALDSRVN
jgi:hypothetical protein